MKFFIITSILCIIILSLMLSNSINKKFGIICFISTIILFLILSILINDNLTNNYDDKTLNYLCDHNLCKLTPSENTLKILPNLYFINLDERVDRLKYVTEHLKEMQYPENKIYRVSAVRNKENGHKGCLESHVKILKMILESDDEYALVIEDDIMFIKGNKETFECIENYIKNYNWNVLLLDCGGIKECGRITDGKKKRGWSNENYKSGCSLTTGYIIKREYIPVLLSVWEPLIGIENWKDSIHSCDQSWKVLQDEMWIVIAPRLATQHTTFSDTENVIHNVTYENNWIRSPDNIPIELESSQKKMLDMLIEFDNISKKYNFKYWVIDGVLLGAIRNKGWIPWDGDIDIGMLKNDFIKFKNTIREELPDTLWLQYIDNDINYTEEKMAKIRDLYSCYIEYSEKNKKSHNGLQIDIFLYNEDQNILSSGFSEDFDPSFLKTDIFPLKTYVFESIEVPIPNEYDKILKKCYGDYMTLPPLSERYPHEGETTTFKTCPHHPTLYPDLYIKYKIEKSSLKTPRVCWIFWFGSENPTSTRIKLIKKMEKNLGVDVILITCNNIHHYLKYPIHPAVPYLSGTHKSDYFKIYFILHYGGACYDIKNIDEDFSKYFDILDTDDYTTVIGHPQTKENIVCSENTQYIKNWSPFLIDNTGFISKPNTKYMKDLHRKQHEVLDKFYNTLKLRSDMDISPPLSCSDVKYDYPLKKTELLGDINVHVGMLYRRNVKTIMTSINTDDHVEKSYEKQLTTKRSANQKWIEEGFLQNFTCVNFCENPYNCNNEKIELYMSEMFEDTFTII